MEARLSTVEEAEALAVAPVAEAIEVPAEDATPREQGTRKRSRIHTVFIADPNDDNYVVCQCQETLGRVCGRSLKPGSSTKPLWTHVEKKHPATYARLSSQEDGNVAHTPAERLASTAQLTVNVNVSYEQMVVSLSHAPLQILSDAIEALQHAREQRSQEA